MSREACVSAAVAAAVAAVFAVVVDYDGGGGVGCVSAHLRASALSSLVLHFFEINCAALIALFHQLALPQLQSRAPARGAAFLGPVRASVSLALLGRPAPTVTSAPATRVWMVAACACLRRR